jgi:ABC-type multidrug transport system fused ATPase/permease subunit
VCVGFHHHFFSYSNVSFAYPNAESVIKDVSFTIGRGQTVVIVGVNGSGKSTLLKLFNRLYDPTVGTVFVDGVPMRSFTASDVRQASAMLFQNYSHYPLPIRENISLGLPDMDPPATYEDEKKGQVTLDELVREAARLGGSTAVAESQPKGFDTVLHPRTYAYSTSFTASASDAFQKKMKEISKTADVSLGQWQRLAL